MPSAEDNIRRLRRPNMFAQADADAAEAERLGITLEEYERGSDIGMWQLGEDRRQSPRNVKRAIVSGPQTTIKPLQNTRSLKKRSDHPDARNDT